MRLALFLLMTGLATACTQFPELDATATPGVADAPYPDLLPIDQLLRGSAARATPEVRAGVEARAAALRGRAEALQGPVIDAATRRRMAGGVATR